MRKENLLCQRMKYFAGAIFVAAVGILLVGLPLYIDTDNYQISTVTAGLLGDNNYCRYISWILCKVIDWLNPLFKSVDWFGLFCRGSAMASVAALTAAVSVV